jgi:NADPH:quinone reductase-like Zn-dependent oxidoreductase
VSIVTLQLAKAMGAQVVITSSSDEKLETCRAIGADFTVNYRSHSDWPKALLEATGGRAADIVVDTVGLASIEQTIDASAPNGRIALIGGLAGMIDKSPNMSGILGKNLTLKGITSGSRAMMQEMLNLVAEKGIEPLVDSRFASDDAPAAFAHLTSGNHMGKVMITFT